MVQQLRNEYFIFLLPQRYIKLHLKKKMPGSLRKENQLLTHNNERRRTKNTMSMAHLMSDSGDLKRKEIFRCCSGSLIAGRYTYSLRYLKNT